MTESLPNVQINFSLIRKPPPSISPRPRNRLPLLGGHCCSSTALDGLTANQPHRCLSFFDVQVYCICTHTHIHAYKYGMLSNAHWSTMAQSHWYMCTNTFTLTAILFFFAAGCRSLSSVMAEVCLKWTQRQLGHWPHRCEVQWLGAGSSRTGGQGF